MIEFYKLFYDIFPTKHNLFKVWILMIKKIIIHIFKKLYFSFFRLLGFLFMQNLVFKDGLNNLLS